MGERICSIEECTGAVAHRRWCMKHYTRWLRHGDPLAMHPKYAPVAEKIAARTRSAGSCLLWTGSLNNKGYGKIGDRYAHRVTYELARGPIPAGLELDHLCRTPACVNPDHLEAGDAQRERATG